MGTDFTNKFETLFNLTLSQRMEIDDGIKINNAISEETEEEEEEDADTPKDCTSIYEDNPWSGSGVHKLNLPDVGIINARCEMTEGKGWTVLLLRDDDLRPHEDFDRSKSNF